MLLPALMAAPLLPTHREIEELKWARLVDEGPQYPKVRLRGNKAKGIAYERRVLREIRDWARGKGNFYPNQWLAFSDKNGSGFAQPDAFVVLTTEVLLFEAKLTQSDKAAAQCQKLYAPLLERIFSRPCVCCQVFKNIRYLVVEMISSAGELEGKRGYWQWHNQML